MVVNFAAERGVSHEGTSMTWEDTFQIITAALGAVGGSAIIIWGLSSWLGKVWANRILEEDKFKYSKELESLHTYDL